MRSSFNHLKQMQTRYWLKCNIDIHLKSSLTITIYVWCAKGQKIIISNQHVLTSQDFKKFYVHIIYDGKYIMCIHVNVFIYNSLVDVYEGWGCRRNGKGGGWPELISIKRVVGRVRASRHYKVHPPPFMEKTEKAVCTDPSPWKS